MSWDCKSIKHFLYRQEKENTSLNDRLKIKGGFFEKPHAFAPSFDQEGSNRFAWFESRLRAYSDCSSTAVNWNLNGRTKKRKVFTVESNNFQSFVFQSERLTKFVPLIRQKPISKHFTSIHTKYFQLAYCYGFRNVEIRFKSKATMLTVIRGFVRMR